MKIAEIVDPGFLFVDDRTSEYMMKLPGDPYRESLEEAGRNAKSRFDRILGVLRAFRYNRGELAEEIYRPVVRDEHGGQIIRVGTLKASPTFPGELEKFADNATRAISGGPGLAETLRLLGRPNRDASEFYMIYELADDEFGGVKGVRDRLGISAKRQKEFTRSANALMPHEGGRHAKTDSNSAPMGLDDLSEFASGLVASWINTYP